VLLEEALIVDSKEIGLEVNADKTKYMVMSRDQNAGKSHSMKIDNSSFERVEEFKYLGTNLTNQNSIQEETKSRLKSFRHMYFHSFSFIPRTCKDISKKVRAMSLGNIFKLAKKKKKLTRRFRHFRTNVVCCVTKCLSVQWY
jgi:hypothetical protein